jgi:hypothetical protein
MIEGEAVEVEPEPPAPEVAPASIMVDTPSVSVSSKSDTAKVVCGAPSPYGDGATCVLPADHRTDVRHRSKDKESW